MSADQQEPRRRYVATIHFVNGDDAVDLATWTLSTQEAAHDWMTSREIGDVIRPYITGTIVTEELRHLEWDRLSMTSPWWQAIEMAGYNIDPNYRGLVFAGAEDLT